MKNENKSIIKGSFCNKVSQSISNGNTEPRTKNKYQIIAICIAAAGLVVAIIANWDKLRNALINLFL